MNAITLDLDAAAKQLLASWPQPQEQDQLESSGTERDLPPVATPYGLADCGYRTDEDGDTYGFVRIVLPHDFVAELEDGSSGTLVALRYYGGDNVVPAS